MSDIVNILLIIISLCLNAVTLEFLINQVPGCSSFITMAQFFFLALYGFIFGTKCGTTKRKIPFWDHLILVFFFFVGKACSSYVHDFNIPMTLVLIFKAGSISENMMIGALVKGRRYSLRKYLAVILITIGIIMSTLASAKEQSGDGAEESNSKIAMGVGLLVLSFIISSCKSVYNDSVQKQHGKHPLESLFYQNALSLLIFALMEGNIINHFSQFNQSLPMILPVLGVSVPCFCLCLALNVITQIVGVHALIVLDAKYDSLTCKVVTVSRTFISLVLSIYLFSVVFTATQWLATGLVFGGTLLYCSTWM